MKPFTQPEWKLILGRCGDEAAYNIYTMLMAADNWEIVAELVFRHDTGIIVQARFYPDADYIDDSELLAWMEGMPPFKVCCDDGFRRVHRFVTEVYSKNCRATIDKVSVIAKLCRES